MNEISANRLRKAAIFLPLTVAAMACGESPTEPRAHVDQRPGEEYVVWGTIVQDGAPAEGVRIVASVPSFEMIMPDYGCWVGCGGRNALDGLEEEIGRTQSDAEGRFEMTLFSCVGPSVRAYIAEGSEWVMVADTVLTASCPMPDELEVHLVVREATP